jgi:hypothetical protein
VEITVHVAFGIPLWRLRSAVDCLGARARRPLEAGANEVTVAVANNFFGWGLMLRLADPAGVQLAAK